MTPKEWAKVKELFSAALEIDASRRGAFLRDACGENAVLRAEVESLLASHDHPASIVETSLAPTARPASAEVIVGQRLGAYQLVKQIGRGGTATVYLAHDPRHDRPVALKVLHPELAATLGRERFLREIRFTAQLQHPHILPVHDSGEAGPMLYYVMPYVEGESLRDRLEREHRLPVDAVMRIGSEVADALNYAHARNVLHRDIKPENILLTGDHALVADFGIARAITAAATDRVTQTGFTVGTPGYMSPEQASGREQLDAGSDVYSLGCVLYEMLVGEPPLLGPSGIAPSETAREVPTRLERAVRKALAEQPADRFSTAAELRHALAPTPVSLPASGDEAVSVPSGKRAALRRSHPVRIALWFGLASLGVLGTVDLLVRGLGLPDWVLYGALALLGVGLPIVLAAGRAERQRILAGTALLGGTPRAPWLTWRTAFAGGVMAFAGLGLATAVYMAGRLFGVGPAGTLIAAGVFKGRERLILATFENRTPDSTLVPALVEAVRVDLSESPTVKLLDQQAVADVLRRMQRAPSTPLDPSLAREVAQRAGVKAVVTGEIDRVGKAYVLGASVVSATDGEVLTAARETAGDDLALIAAIDRLSRKLRERIGESLRTIRAGQPLEQVTTASLEALRKYSEARRAEDIGDYDRAAAGYQEATLLDTEFAMAYRKLSVMLRNVFASRERINAATTKAFELRRRLPEVERHLATGNYYENVDYQPAKAVAAYRELLDLDPENAVALNNLARDLIPMREFREAESLAVRASRLGATLAFYYNAIDAQAGQGHYADAEATLERFRRLAPHSGMPLVYGILIASAQGRYAAAERIGPELEREPGVSPTVEAFASGILSGVNGTQGKVSRGQQKAEDEMALGEQRGLPQAYLVAALRAAELDLRLRNQPSAGLKRVDAALKRHPITSMPPIDRPYALLARYYARAGRLGEAKRLLSEYEKTVPDGIRRGDKYVYGARGDILLEEGRIPDAVGAYQQWSEAAQCGECGFFFEIATAYERMGQDDSAAAFYERVVATAGTTRVLDDASTLGPSLRRLGELYEARGDRGKAVEYYARFVDLWKDADPELQPQIVRARAAIKRLGGEQRPQSSALLLELPIEVRDLVQFLRGTGWRRDEGRLSRGRPKIGRVIIRLEDVRSKRAPRVPLGAGAAVVPRMRVPHLRRPTMRASSNNCLTASSGLSRGGRTGRVVGHARRDEQHDADRESLWEYSDRRRQHHSRLCR